MGSAQREVEREVYQGWGWRGGAMLNAYAMHTYMLGYASEHVRAAHEHRQRDKYETSHRREVQEWSQCELVQGISPNLICDPVFAG